MKTPEIPNLLAELPLDLPAELVETVVNSQNVRIERIVSTGHVSAANFWYDQEEHEWVLVVQGKAKLAFDGDDQSVMLQAGDHVLIPAHCRHRIEWTTPDEPTVWLAVFYRG